MYCEDYKQLSLIAEGVAGDPLRDDVEYDYCDWSIDTAPSPELQRSIERVLDYFDGGQIKNSPPTNFGGQPQTRILPMGGNGGQTKNRQHLASCPPKDPAKKSMFARAEGDEGTWIEIDRRKSGDYRYLRWREGKIKRGKYLGKAA
jgi:hypothetical protein